MHTVLFLTYNPGKNTCFFYWKLTFRVNQLQEKPIPWKFPDGLCWNWMFDTGYVLDLDLKDLKSPEMTFNVATLFLHTCHTLLKLLLIGGFDRHGPHMCGH